MPDQSLVAAGGVEDHQPHPKTMEHPTSPTDDGTPTMPDQSLAAAGGEEDHQPHSKTLKHPTSSMDDGTPNKPDFFIESRHELQTSLYLSSTQMTLLEGPSYYPLETMGRG